MKRTLLAILLFPSLSHAHGGGTDAYGCHNQSSTGLYHCHSGTFAGQSFSSKTAMLQRLGSTTTTPTTQVAPTQPTTPVTPTTPTVTTVTTVPVAYDRDLYQHWIDADGDCQDARQEVLIAESVIPVTLTSNGCDVVSGLWNDPYTGKSFTNPSDLDIDHMIPLKEAHDSGAWAWSSALKRAFANDLDKPYILIAVDDGANQSKSDRDPAVWMPPNAAYHCEYIKSWVLAKDAYGLSMDTAEKAAINNVLSTRAAGPKSRPGASSIGAQTSTSFTLGLTRPGVCGYMDSSPRTAQISIAGTVSPDSRHIGQKADLVVVIQAGSSIFMRTKAGAFLPWDMQVSTLAPATEGLTLNRQMNIDVFTGALGIAAGLDIFLGYKLQSGELVYSSTPVRLDIQ